MKKTRMPQRLLSLVLVLMMLISVLPVSAMAAELTPSDPETGLTATDVTNELTDSDRLAIFEENMDSSKVSRSEIPADDEMVKVIVQLDADSLLDVRNRTNASMSMLDFQQTDAAKAQLKDIANLQLSVMNTMESKGIPSSFTFSYTSVVSGFAALDSRLNSITLVLRPVHRDGHIIQQEAQAVVAEGQLDMRIVIFRQLIDDALDLTDGEILSAAVQVENAQELAVLGRGLVLARLGAGRGGECGDGQQPDHQNHRQNQRQQSLPRRSCLRLVHFVHSFP